MPLLGSITNHEIWHLWLTSVLRRRRHAIRIGHQNSTAHSPSAPLLHKPYSGCNCCILLCCCSSVPPHVIPLAHASSELVIICTRSFILCYFCAAKYIICDIGFKIVIRRWLGARLILVGVIFQIVTRDLSCLPRSSHQILPSVAPAILINTHECRLSTLRRNFLCMCMCRLRVQEHSTVSPPFVRSLSPQARGICAFTSLALIRVSCSSAGLSRGIHATTSLRAMFISTIFIGGTYPGARLRHDYNEHSSKHLQHTKSCNCTATQKGNRRQNCCETRQGSDKGSKSKNHTRASREANTKMIEMQALSPTTKAVLILWGRTVRDSNSARAPVFPQSVTRRHMQFSMI